MWVVCLFVLWWLVLGFQLFDVFGFLLTLNTKLHILISVAAVSTVCTLELIEPFCEQI